MTLMTLTGHAGAWSAFTEEPLRTGLTLLLLVLYIVAATLIGQRRALGGLIALALFASVLMEQAWRGRLLSFGTLWPLLGIVLVLRAGRALGFPFTSARSPKQGSG